MNTQLTPLVKKEEPEVMPQAVQVINNCSQSSFEFATTAKGELTYTVKIYANTIDEAREEAERQVIAAENWKKENWINYQEAVNTLSKKIEALELQLNGKPKKVTSEKEKTNEHSNSK